MATELKYKVFQNKALDYNKLLGEQKKGKLLKKILKFPVIAMVKYDGHYCVIDVVKGEKTFLTSGGIKYTHSTCTQLDGLLDGTYIAERVVGDGKLGASRRGVALEGSVGAKYAKANNTYKIHNRLCIDKPYLTILESLGSYAPIPTLPFWKSVPDQTALDAYMKQVTVAGYEGLMLIQPDYLFKDTKSRHIDFCKYKKRPTADLVCVSTIDGTGKYAGMIGSLVLMDSKRRCVAVGSGMSDEDRSRGSKYFLGMVIEIEYEQIAETYIQPTFGSDTVGVTIREDKHKEDID